MVVRETEVYPRNLVTVRLQFGGLLVFGFPLQALNIGIYPVFYPLLRCSVFITCAGRVWLALRYRIPLFIYYRVIVLIFYFFSFDTSVIDGVEEKHICPLPRLRGYCHRRRATTAMSRDDHAARYCSVRQVLGDKLGEHLRQVSVAVGVKSQNPIFPIPVAARR